MRIPNEKKNFTSMLKMPQPKPQQWRNGTAKNLMLKNENAYTLYVESVIKKERETNKRKHCRNNKKKSKKKLRKTHTTEKESITSATAVTIK